MTPRRQRRRPHWKRITRDTVTFTAGLVMLGHETFLARPPDYGLIVAALTLMGFPSVLLANDTIQRRRGGESSSEPKGYYRVLEFERRWDRERDQRRREWDP